MWDNLFPESILPRSRYERVIIHAIAGEKLHMNGDWFTPVGMRGWSQVVFRRDHDGTRHLFSLDYLLQHLRDWGSQRRHAHSRRGEAASTPPFSQPAPRRSPEIRA